MNRGIKDRKNEKGGLMKTAMSIVLIGIVVTIIVGCGSRRRVMVPPRVDLAAYETVGVIEFECSNKGDIASYATEQFIEAIRRDQGLVKIVELGPERDVLRAIGAKRLTPTALQDIGEQYNVNSVFHGRVDISDIRPNVILNPFVVSVDAEVDAKLSVKMAEVAEGASIWSGSSMATAYVGNISVYGGGAFSFDAEDPDDAYGKLVYALIDGVSGDFQVRWRWVRD